jgi:hypothetical protein
MTTHRPSTANIATQHPNGHEAGLLDPVQANWNWRVWVSGHPIAGALLAGFVATHVATIFGFWMKGIGLPQLNWPVVNGNVVLPTASDPVKFVIGEVFIHGIDGVVFTLIYAIVLFPIMSRLMGGAVSPAANMAKGILYGLVLATISVGFLTPYVYYAHSGAGLFSTGFGWKLIVAIYLWHIAFGANLGLLYNPIGRRESSRLHAQ